MSQTQSGFLLVADITGYTMFLSESELEHAQEILSTLMELLIEHTRPPLLVSSLEGDAVMSYALRGTDLRGQTFVEMVENTYVAFRQAIEIMVLNNTCQCNACANVANLDLKFFMHYGAFTIQRLSGHDQLVGSDVNLLHRLLKNHVIEQTGIRAYTLYTEAALEKLGLEGMRETMVPHRESYEHLEEVEVWVQDMHPVWQAKQDDVRVTIPPERVVVDVSVDIDMAPYELWDFMSRPEYRALAMNAERQEIVNARHGRIAPGTEFHCYHGGNRESNQVILVWHPFEQMTTQDTTPVPKTTVLVNVLYTPTETGTRMTFQFSRSTGPWWGRIICDFVLARLSASFGNALLAFKERVESDLAAREYGADEHQHSEPEPGQYHPLKSSSAGRMRRA